MKSNNLIRLALAAVLAGSLAMSAFAQAGPGGQGGQGGRPPMAPGGPQGGMRQGPGRSLGLLIRMSSVQRELKLTQEQIQKINEMRPRQGGPGQPPMPPGNPGQGGQGGRPPVPPGGQGGQEGPGGRRPGAPGNGPLAEILNETQMKRLQQLAIQFDAPMTLLDPRTGRQLNLSEQQREQISQIIRENGLEPPRPPQPPMGGQGGEGRPPMPPNGQGGPGAGPGGQGGGRPPMGQGGAPGRMPNGPQMNFAEMQAKKAKAFNAAWNVLTAEQKSKWNELTGARFTAWEEPKRPQQP
jgi:hypothetical protein